MSMKERQETLKEISPFQSSKRQTRIIKYKRVWKKALERDKLGKIWELANAKKVPMILEDRRFLYFQYPGKPVILVKKSTGRLYCVGKETRWIKHQAGLILRILNEYGLVKGFERRTVSKKAQKLMDKK